MLPYAIDCDPVASWFTILLHYSITKHNLMLPSIEQRLASELSVKFSQVQATIQLLDDGATVPFIARYRKEATGGLDDAQLRLLAEHLHSLRELEKRRAAIIAAIEKLGKMTPPLLDALTHATDKAHLEDFTCRTARNVVPKRRLRWRRACNRWRIRC